jgi:hypothetical protein
VIEWSDATEERLDGRFVGKVRRMTLGSLAEKRDRGIHPALLPRDHNDVRAFSRRRFGDGKADSRSTSQNENALA